MASVKSLVNNLECLGPLISQTLFGRYRDTFNTVTFMCASNTLSELHAGYFRFSQKDLGQKQALYRQLAEGQTPEVMVIACADSRVDPAVIFDASPGELFITRNVANLVPPFEEKGAYHGTSAAIEFAVRVLKVKHIVVLGHGQCGGIEASLAAAGLADKKLEGDHFLSSWVGILDETRDQVLHQVGDQPVKTIQKALEFAAIRHSIQNLKTFPFVQQAISEGQLSLEGAWFAIKEASLFWLGRDDKFAPVVIR